jgi:hypothetical protein
MLQDVPDIEYEGAARRDGERLPQTDLSDQFRGNSEGKDQEADKLQCAAQALTCHGGQIVRDRAEARAASLLFR